MRQRNGKSRRSVLRRAVQVECEVVSDYWDEPLPMPASDLSHQGLWLDTPLPIETGEQLLVALTPPDGRAKPLHAVAEVARVGLWRRRRDRFPVGMGLRFVDIHRTDRERLRQSLLGIPPRLPRRRLTMPPPLPPTYLADLALPPVLDPETPLEDFSFSSLAELITSPAGSYAFRN